jgi:hypothetical protein
MIGTERRSSVPGPDHGESLGAVHPTHDSHTGVLVGGRPTAADAVTIRDRSCIFAESLAEPLLRENNIGNE